MIEKPQGLILVTGGTGSGKTTTLAAMIDCLSREHHYHIITIEDLIEFLYNHNNSIINQREVKIDTDDFHIALKSIFRQDPDVVLVGEMRDYEVMDTVLTIAETGHLVLSTLHTYSAIQTINRIIIITLSRIQISSWMRDSFFLKLS